MGAYEGTGRAELLRENRQEFLWQNETIPASVITSLSKAVQLERVRSAAYPWAFSIEISFSGTPGIFEIDVMGADTDDYKYFNVMGQISSVNSYNVGRLDGIASYYPKYVAVYMKTLTNAVTVSAQITR